MSVMAKECAGAVVGPLDVHPLQPRNQAARRLRHELMGTSRGCVRTWPPGPTFASRSRSSRIAALSR
jgi:hypothetical protein